MFVFIYFFALDAATVKEWDNSASASSANTVSKGQWLLDTMCFKINFCFSHYLFVWAAGKSWHWPVCITKIVMLLIKNLSKSDLYIKFIFCNVATVKEQHDAIFKVKWIYQNRTITCYLSTSFFGKPTCFKKYKD